MKRKIYAVLCVLTLLCLSGCNPDGGSSSPSSPNESIENAETTAITYMKEKYGLDCIVIENYLYPNDSTGGSYYKLWMRCADDTNGEKLKEKAGQGYLDNVNNAQKLGSAFAVYIDNTPERKGAVIGDQYMWYTVYVLFDAWINAQSSQYAPCRLYCGYRDFCTTDLEFPYCFSPDFPIITTKDELEKQISQMNVSIRAFYPESLNLKLTQSDWDLFQSHIETDYPFHTFGMRVYEVPEAVYQTLSSEEVMFQNMDFTSYPSCVIAFANSSPA